MLQAFDISFEDLKKDVERFKEMGATKALFKNPNRDEEINLKVRDVLDDNSAFSLWPIF